MSDFGELSDYTVRLQPCDKLVQNTEVFEPITFEEIVVVMINLVTGWYDMALYSELDASMVIGYWHITPNLKFLFF